MPCIPKTRRLIQILMRLQNGRVYNSTQLAEFCGVSNRTLFRYLRELQDAGVPILHDSERLGYWLPLNEGAPQMRLSPQEVLSMLLLCEHGGARETGIPYLEPAAHASQFILTQLSDAQRTRMSRLTSLIEIHLQSTPSDSLHRDIFEQLLTAMEERVRIRIHLTCANEGLPLCTLVSPYRLLFQDRAWQMIGRSSLHRSVQTFPLSEIERIESTTDRYTIPPRFTTQSYLARAG
jgi:predicted DNA-binding transcriptional regulator YafY